MNVYFPGPDRETYHPQLGKLVKDQVFDLPAKETRLYIKAGLLKKGRPVKQTAGSIQNGK